MGVSLVTKRRIVLAVLILTTIWPMTHHVIVRAFDHLSPWKGFGWSMYCVPYRAVNVRFYAVDERRELYPDIAIPPMRAQVADALREFAKRRTVFGYRAVPDEFGAVLLNAFPMIRAVRIEVVEHVVDHETARMTRDRDDQYVYERAPS